MTEMQFSAMVLMSLLAVTLIVLLPRRVMTEPVLNRSRWLMVGGTALVAVQFLLQYTFGFRQMGVTQAVMVNDTKGNPIGISQNAFSRTNRVVAIGANLDF